MINAMSAMPDDFQPAYGGSAVVGRKSRTGQVAAAGAATTAAGAAAYRLSYDAAAKGTPKQEAALDSLKQSRSNLKSEFKQRQKTTSTFSQQAAKKRESAGLYEAFAEGKAPRIAGRNPGDVWTQGVHNQEAAKHARRLHYQADQLDRQAAGAARRTQNAGADLGRLHGAITRNKAAIRTPLGFAPKLRRAGKIGVVAGAGMMGVAGAKAVYDNVVKTDGRNTRRTTAAAGLAAGSGVVAGYSHQKIRNASADAASRHADLAFRMTSDRNGLDYYTPQRVANWTGTKLRADSAHESYSRGVANLRAEGASEKVIAAQQAKADSARRRAQIADDRLMGHKAAQARSDASRAAFEAFDPKAHAASLTRRLRPTRAAAVGVLGASLVGLAASHRSNERRRVNPSAPAVHREYSGVSRPVERGDDVLRGLDASQMLAERQQWTARTPRAADAARKRAVNAKKIADAKQSAMERKNAIADARGYFPGRDEMDSWLVKAPGEK